MRVWRKLGKIIFWVAWPIWWIIFKISPNRTRIIVVNQNKILLVQGWLGDGKWGLPGGGVKFRETNQSAAARELWEETGLHTEESALKSLWSMNHRQRGLSYKAHYYLLEMSSEQEPKVQRVEIVDCRWFAFNEIHSSMLNEDASNGLKHYLPAAQAQLL